jgi:hypothetical protein
METLTLINGNKQAYTIDLPRILWMTKNINEIALAHIKENTGLEFVQKSLWYETQPTSYDQIVALFLTYDFKTRYYNNADYRNTLMIKSDHHVGFEVDSICFSCCEENHIPTYGLNPDSRLAC